MENLWEKIKKSLANGVSIAAEKTEELTKLGKVKIEILNTKHKVSKAFTELGGIAYESIKTGKTKDFGESAEVKKLVNTIKKLEAELDKKEESYKDLKKKGKKEK